MLDKICKWFLIAIIFTAFGYWLCWQVFSSYESHVEKQLLALEGQFYLAIEKPQRFYIFNRQFEVIPLKNQGKFYYRKIEDN